MATKPVAAPIQALYETPLVALPTLSVLAPPEAAVGMALAYTSTAAPVTEFKTFKTGPV